MAPGPNMMMIVSFGEWAGGLLGALVTVVMFFGPTAMLAFVASRCFIILTKLMYNLR